MKILLIEDEMRVADFLRRGLLAEGWSVEHALDGETGLALARDHAFDVILLDLMLPGIKGQEVCRILRTRSVVTPIIMLSALDAIDERIEGLTLGADDYLAKPFDFDELVARIITLHRRANRYVVDTEADKLKLAGIVFDKTSYVVTVDGEPIDLTAKERELLVYFLQNAGRAISRERILNAIWGVNADPLTNIVDVYVGRLRRKLGDKANTIATVRFIGYRFAPATADEPA